MFPSGHTRVKRGSPHGAQHPFATNTLVTIPFATPFSPDEPYEKTTHKVPRLMRVNKLISVS